MSVVQGGEKEFPSMKPSRTSFVTGGEERQKKGEHKLGPMEGLVHSGLILICTVKQEGLRWSSLGGEKGVLKVVKSWLTSGTYGIEIRKKSPKKGSSVKPTSSAGENQESTWEKKGAYYYLLERRGLLKAAISRGKKKILSSAGQGEPRERGKQPRRRRKKKIPANFQKKYLTPSLSP